jgi:hypothetical protein
LYQREECPAFRSAVAADTLCGIVAHYLNNGSVCNCASRPVVGLAHSRKELRRIDPVSFPAQVELAALEFDAAVQDLEVRVLDHSGKLVFDRFHVSDPEQSALERVDANTRYVLLEGDKSLHSRTIYET